MLEISKGPNYHWFMFELTNGKIGIGYGRNEEEAISKVSFSDKLVKFIKKTTKLFEESVNIASINQKGTLALVTIREEGEFSHYEIQSFDHNRNKLGSNEIFVNLNKALLCYMIRHNKDYFSNSGVKD